MSDTLAPQRRKWDPIIRHGVAFVPLGRSHEAVIDVDDIPLVQGRTWSPISGGRYAACSAKRDGTPLVYMHRLILGMGPDDPRHVDHIDGDGLNNRRSNLRPATPAQNSANQRTRGGSSRFKGVSWASRERKWRAYVKVDGRQIGGGYFADEVEAAHAHDRLALDAFGEFARLNFPAGVLT